MLKRFIKYYKPHRWLFCLTMAAAVAGAGLTVLIPAITRRLLDECIPNNDLMGIIQNLIWMLMLIVITTVMSYIRVKWGHILGVRMEFDMRAEFFGHIQKLSFNYFDNVKTGHLMSRIASDLNQIAEVAHHAPEDLMISLTLLVGAFIAMFSFNAPLAAIAILPIPFMIGWGVFYGGSMRKGFRNVRKRIADINSRVENSVQGIREVKSYANEEEEIDKFEVVNISFRSAKEKMYGIMAIFFSVMSFLIESYFFVVIAGGVILIHFGNEVTSGDLLAFILYVYFILNPIRRLVNFAEQFQQGAACFERFTEVMDIEPDIVDKKDAHIFEPVKGEIIFDHVSFKYAQSHETVLEDISLQIPSHKTIAIVGESGAGKSTVVSLIPRFYEPQQGTIRIDGHDIMDLKQKFLRENIGIVQQNVFLFDSTIRDNIMYGNPDASEEQLIDAAQKANIYDYIQSLPEGFDTLVGERGVKLSGGQKQRISIARVFLKNPPVFIFDEATSSLDTESELLIQQSLELLSQNRTTVIIAHRLSTIKNADYLYVMNQGRIVEHGTHTQLLEKKDYYHKLYTMNLF
ncbi:MAG: thiamine ABC transporter permease [Planctomycetales bacterium 4572_13]|nr:MAG: thiamine ABC transporter permease [Planctomycetales bacterium 4572_13]